MAKYLFTGFIVVEADSKEEACKEAEGVYNSLNNTLGQADGAVELDFGPFTEEECVAEDELPPCDCDDCNGGCDCDGCDDSEECNCDEGCSCEGACDCEVLPPKKHLLN